MTTTRFTHSVRTSARLAFLAGLALAAAGPAAGAGASEDEFSNLPQTITLTGTVRDFRRFDVASGHPDFEKYNTGHRMGLVNDQLDSDGKPTLKHRRGLTVNQQFRDSSGNNIIPALYDAAKGDTAGRTTLATSDAVLSPESFAQWYRDVAGVNVSFNHSVTLNRVDGTNRYYFYDQDDNGTNDREGFFPADGKGWNDTDPTYKHNYHFTFELSTTFQYKRGTGQVFTFVGDDDVYVFINGQLAIDVGGVHGAVSQSVDLDRFADKYGLQDGKDYALKFFFAERHLTRSNCRIETTLTLRNAELPATTALND